MRAGGRGSARGRGPATRLRPSPPPHPIVIHNTASQATVLHPGCPCSSGVPPSHRRLPVQVPTPLGPPRGVRQLHIPNPSTTIIHAVNSLLAQPRTPRRRRSSSQHVHPRRVLLIISPASVRFRPSVRFRLPLTPPAHGTEMPPKSTLYRQVGTKDSSPEILKLNRSASKWTKADLRLLGVDYQYDCVDDIHLGIEDADMPAELLQRHNLFMARLICSH